MEANSITSTINTNIDSEPANVEYGESQVETNIFSSAYATIDDLLDISEQIYKDVLKYYRLKGWKSEHEKNTTLEALHHKLSFTKIGNVMLQSKKSKTLTPIAPSTKKSISPISSLEHNDKQDEYSDVVRKLQQEYKDFNITFPIFIRCTVQTGDYNKKAMRAFLEKHSRTRMQSMTDFLELQKDYVIYLYRETHPHWNPKDVIRMSQNILDALHREHKEFKDMADEVDKDFKEYELKQRKHIIALIHSTIKTQTK